MHRRPTAGWRLTRPHSAATRRISVPLSPPQGRCYDTPPGGTTRRSPLRSEASGVDCWATAPWGSRGRTRPGRTWSAVAVVSVRIQILVAQRSGIAGEHDGEGAPQGLVAGRCGHPEPRIGGHRHDRIRSQERHRMNAVPATSRQPRAGSPHPAFSRSRRHGC